MWTGFIYRDTSDEVSRKGWWEKWKKFADYEWIFTESTPSGACLILTTTRDGHTDANASRLKPEPDASTEWPTPQNSCTIS